jgi:hypothetical protein
MLVKGAAIKSQARGEFRTKIQKIEEIIVSLGENHHATDTTSRTDWGRGDCGHPAFIVDAC